MSSRLWTEQNCETVKTAFNGKTIRTIDDIFNIVDEIDRRQIIEVFRMMEQGHKPRQCFTTSPKGVVYRAYALGCISENERDILLSIVDEWIKENAVSGKLRKDVKERDGYECQLCGSENNLCIDHIVPIRYGGKTEIDNLQTLCRKCNRYKFTHIADFRNGSVDYILCPETGTFEPLMIPGWTLLFSKSELEKMQKIVSYPLIFPED